MKKRLTVFLVFLLIFIFSSCDTPVNEQINQMLSNIPAIFEPSTAQSSTSDTGFQKILKNFTDKDKAYFASSEREMNKNPLNQKYSYAVSAYHQSNGICDTAAMFFAENAAEELNLYFRLYGYVYKEYSQNEKKAVLKCEKDGAIYIYEVSYSEEPVYFEILIYKNDAVIESFKCSLTEDSIEKVYYDDNIKQLIVSLASSDGSVSVSWYGTEFIEGFSIPENEPSGSVTYKDGVLSEK